MTTASKKQLSKDSVLALVKERHSSLTFAKPTSMERASKWLSRFSFILIDNARSDFVICDVCKTVVTYKIVTGTGGMQKHVESCDNKTNSSISDQKTISTYFASSKGSKNGLVNRAKTSITTALAEFIATDGRSFETINGVGFKNVFSLAFQAGRTLNSLAGVSSDDLLPSPITVSREVDRVYAIRKAQLKSLCEAMESFVTVVDFWSEKYTGVHYGGVSISTIDHRFRSHVFLLACRPYDLENQTAPNVRKFVDLILLEFGLKLHPRSYVVSDNENKMKAAFGDVVRVGCADHYLNKLLQHAFTTASSDTQEVQGLFDIIRGLASHIRKSHRQSGLTRKVQGYSETRFNGAFHMLANFSELYHEIPQVLNPAHLVDYAKIDDNLLKQVCEFVQVFDEVIEALSDDKRPTLHRVIPLRQLLIDRCTLDANDSYGLAKLKCFLSQEIEVKWIAQNEHFIATCLHPNLKQFGGNKKNRDKAVKLLKAEVVRRANVGSSKASSTSDCLTELAFIDRSSSSSTSSPIDTPAKKNIINECYDKPKSASIVNDEISLWMNFTVSFQQSSEDDILAFWATHCAQFPTIAAVAREILAIPASNTNVERLFSAAKNTVSDRRTRLGASKLDKLLFIQKNLAKLKALFDEQPLSSVRYDEENSSKRKLDDVDSSQSDEKVMRIDQQIVTDENENLILGIDHSLF